MVKISDGGTYFTLPSLAFNGGGLNDLYVWGDFSNASSISYKVEIDGTGSPDTFKWSDDGGVSWDGTEVSIPLNYGEYFLSNGMKVQFSYMGEGHTVGDFWTFTCNPGTSSKFQWKKDASEWIPADPGKPIGNGGPHSLGAEGVNITFGESYGTYDGLITGGTVDSDKWYFTITEGQTGGSAAITGTTGNSFAIGTDITTGQDITLNFNDYGQAYEFIK